MIHVFVQIVVKTVCLEKNLLAFFSSHDNFLLKGILIVLFFSVRVCYVPIISKNFVIIFFAYDVVCHVCV